MFTAWSWKRLWKRVNSVFCWKLSVYVVKISWWQFFYQRKEAGTVQMCLSLLRRPGGPCFNCLPCLDCLEMETNPSGTVSPERWAPSGCPHSTVCSAWPGTCAGVGDPGGVIVPFAQFHRTGDVQASYCMWPPSKFKVSNKDATFFFSKKWPQVAWEYKEKANVTDLATNELSIGKQKINLSVLWEAFSSSSIPLYSLPLPHSRRVIRRTLQFRI